MDRRPLSRGKGPDIKNLIFQLGISDGTETPIRHSSARATNLVPYNPLHTGSTFPKDPGNQPSFTSCIRYSRDDERNNLQPCVNGINRGNRGYNDLQWYGATYCHKFNDHWHVSLESYYEYRNGVPNANNPQAVSIYRNGGTPFSPRIIRFNAPNLAQCGNANTLRCRASATGAVGYLNCSPEALDDFPFRPEYYHDPQGQRTGVKADCFEFTVGWQHWFSPQIEVRPELGYWIASRSAVNGSPSRGIAPNEDHTFIAASDLILHF